ncbi:MAG: PilC/PilY family type IV pilus protein, partial [Betaproteobacteria bacterium]
LFIAKDSSGNLQPITQRVEVGINAQGGVLIYFGTGQYITINDNSTTSAQTFYGIWDKGATVIGRSSLLQQTVTGTASASGGNYRLTSNNGNASTMFVAPSTYKGWYIDLPSSGERQVSDPVLNGGRIIFTTLIPSLTACSSGGSGWLMELDPTTGNQPATPAFDSDNNRSINALDITASGVQTSAIASTPGIVQLPAVSTIGGGSNGGTLQRKYMSESDATIGNVLENAASIQSKRVMWRQFK